MISSRRSFITGLISFSATAPAIVRASSLMPVKAVDLVDGGSSNGRDGTRIENIFAVPENDIQKMVRGTVGFAVLIWLAYLVGRRWV